MRIRRLTVKNFGKFENYAVDFNGNLAVINGLNEAGKSTIFDMIKILLFGLGEDIKPEERMRYVRFGANEAQISGEFECADGTPLSLSRRISKNSCDLNVNENFNFQNLGNVTAPIVSHLTKEVYENIYALDFHTMSAIKDDVWQGIKDEFMGADMAKELVSSNDAIDIARSKADNLYRKDGAPSIISELTNKRDALKEKLADLNENQQKASADYLSLDSTKRNLMDMQNKIEFENAFIAEANKMNSLKEDVSKIKLLAQQAGDLSIYKKWLPNIREEYEALKQEADSAQELILKAKETEQEPKESILQIFDEKYSKVLECEEAIYLLEYEEAETTPMNLDNDADKKYTQAKDDWLMLQRELLKPDSKDEDVLNSLDQINTISMSEKLQAYINSKNNLNDLISSNNKPESNGSRTFFFVITFIFSILSILTGVLLFFSNFVLGQLKSIPPLDGWFDIFVRFFEVIPFSQMIVADVLCGLGLIMLIIAFVFIKGKSKRSHYKNRDDDIKKQRVYVELTRVEFEKQLFGLTFPKMRIKKPDLNISEDINQLKQSRQLLHEAQMDMEKYDEKIDQTINEKMTGSNANDEIDKIAAMLFDIPSNDVKENLASLKALLNSAKNAKIEYDADTKNTPITPEDKPDSALVDELESKSQKAKDEYNELALLLGDDAGNEILDIQDRYNKLNRAVVLRDEVLEKYPDFKEIADRLNHLNQAGWPYDDDAIDKAKDRIEQLRNEIAQKQSNIGVMENTIKIAILGDSPSEIASQVIKAEEEILRYKNDYDKLRISEQVIRQGHDTFSKLHQPEVLQRAGYYLSILTGGKYSEIELSNDTSEITVLTEEGKFMTPHFARLSQATCEQIYLSIRLSVIESFDADTEIMPITLDEALITWDTERLTAGLDLIAQIARKRQILIFTCHDFIVDILRENQPTAQIIDLK